MNTIKKDWASIQGAIHTAVTNQVNTLVATGDEMLDAAVQEASQRLAWAVKHNRPELAEEISDALTVHMLAEEIELSQNVTDDMVVSGMGVGLGMLVKGAIAGLTGVTIV